MEGRSSDYIVKASGSHTRCANCYRKFLLNQSIHVYKRIGFGKSKYFCSYSCMRAWDKEQQEKDRNKNRSARNIYTGKYEKKTLQKWASEFGVNYDKLWTLNVLNKISLPDAISMLQMERQYEKMEDDKNGEIKMENEMV